MIKNNLSKIRKIIIVTELILMLIMFCSLFAKNRTYSVNVYDDEESTLELFAGRYFITAEYEEIDDNLFIWLSDEEGTFNGAKTFTDYNVLPHARTEYTSEFWVTGISDKVKFNLEYMTDNIGKINSVTIEQTKFLKICVIIMLFFIIILTLIVFAAIDGILKKKSIITIFFILGLAVAASLPAFSKYIPLGFDSYFHINRIEGIKDGLLSGQFPVKVEPTFLGGYGYAASTFYGSLFMYVPAILRLMGFSLQFSYKFLLFFINLMMAVSSYYFFKEVSKRNKYGVMGSALYTLSMYKFCNTYYRGAIGEATAMAALPVVALGLWNIYTKTKDEKYKYRWIIPAIGYTAIIQSHLISTEIVGGFTIIICLLLFKKTFKKETFLVLLKTVIATIFLNLGFLAPFFESLNKLNLVGNQWDNVKIVLQESGIDLNNIFSFQIPQFTTKIWYEQVYYIGLGLSFFVVVLVSVFVLAKTIINKKLDYKLIFTQIISLISVLMVTKYFPWNNIINFFKLKLGNIGMIIANMFANLQYSYRIAIVTTLALSLLAVITMMKLEKISKNVTTLVIVIITSLSFVQCILLEASVISTQNKSEQKIAFINELNVGLNNIIGLGEYLQTDPDGNWVSISNKEEYATNKSEIIITEHEKKYNNITFKVKNNTKDEGLVYLPLFYYLGYSAKDINTGEKIGLYNSEDGRITLVIEGETERTIEIKYTGKKLWRVCEFISLISFLYIVFLGAKSINKNVTQIKPEKINGLTE